MHLTASPWADVCTMVTAPYIYDTRLAFPSCACGGGPPCCESSNAGVAGLHRGRGGGTCRRQLHGPWPVVPVPLLLSEPAHWFQTTSRAAERGLPCAGDLGDTSPSGGLFLIAPQQQNQPFVCWLLSESATNQQEGSGKPPSIGLGWVVAACRMAAAPPRQAPPRGPVRCKSILSVRVVCKCVYIYVRRSLFPT